MVTLTVPARLAHIGLLRGVVAGLASYYAGQAVVPTPDDLHAWSLGIYEAGTNIVRHGHDGGSDAPIRLTIEPGAGWVVFTLRDRGRPNPAWPPLMEAPSPDQEGGHGLWIIRQVFAQVDYGRDGDENVLRLEARFPGSRPGDDGLSAVSQRNRA
jgi:anti-sigma regulatory factor (Ser/Thr protein kinase)